MVHELKTDSYGFQAVFAGDKTQELRCNDRDYHVMDWVILKETKWSGDEMKAGWPLVYTGRAIAALVTHILYGPMYSLPAGWVILSLKVLYRTTALESRA